MFGLIVSRIQLHSIQISKYKLTMTGHKHTIKSYTLKPNKFKAPTVHTYIYFPNTLSLMSLWSKIIPFNISVHSSHAFS